MCIRDSYWGSAVQEDSLHFEACYYQGIEHCIENGLAVFEPGHGGEHQDRRGFLPEITWSNHRIAHPGLHDALRRHTEKEAQAVRRQVEALTAKAPVHGGDGEEPRPGVPPCRDRGRLARTASPIAMPATETMRCPGCNPAASANS